MSRKKKPPRGKRWAEMPADEPEPQVTDPETRERIREKSESGALDESGGPLPEEVAVGELSRNAQEPSPGLKAE
jgi:hypothetical protein